MVTIAKMYHQCPDVKKLIKNVNISSAGNDVNAQIAQVNQMIPGGVDAIVDMHEGEYVSRSPEMAGEIAKAESSTPVSTWFM